MPLIMAERKQEMGRSGKVAPPSIPYEGAAHDPVFDESNKLMRPRIPPPKLLSALIAMAEAPRMSREPRVFESRYARGAASRRARKGDDLETNSHRIYKTEFSRPFVFKTIAFAGNTVQAPGAKPILPCIAQLRKRSSLKERFGDAGHKRTITDRR